MFPGRPMPQPAFTNQISPEALVAAGRLHGRAEADSEKYEEGWHDGYNLGLQHGHTNGWNAAADEANKVISEDRLDGNRAGFFSFVFQDTLEDLIMKNPALKREILAEVRKNYEIQIKYFLARKGLRMPPHQDIKYLSEAPRMKKFMKEVFG